MKKILLMALLGMFSMSNDAQKAKLTVKTQKDVTVKLYQVDSVGDFLDRQVLRVNPLFAEKYMTYLNWNNQYIMWLRNADSERMIVFNTYEMTSTGLVEVTLNSRFKDFNNKDAVCNIVGDKVYWCFMPG